MKQFAMLFVVLTLAFPTFAQMTGGAPSGGSVSGGAPVVTEPAPPKVVYFQLGESLPDGQYSVYRIIDADTLTVLEGNVQRSVRILGVDSPERGEAYRNESSAFASALLSGATVTLEQDSQPIDGYGRALAYVTLPGGQDYSLLLLQAGLAVPFDRYPVKRTALYDAASTGAESVGKGPALSSRTTTARSSPLVRSLRRSTTARSPSTGPTLPSSIRIRTGWRANR